MAKKKQDNESTEESKAPPKKAPRNTAKSAASEKTTELKGYAKDFEHWEPVDSEKTGPVTIAPSKLITVFDVRASTPNIDTIRESVKQNGVMDAVKITQMRFTGETGQYAVSPDPAEMVKLTKGSSYYVLVYGRRRTRASLAEGLAEIPADVQNYKHWSEMVYVASTENREHAKPTTWDNAMKFKKLVDGGQTQDQVAKHEGVSAGVVGQHIGVFDLDERVIRYVKNGELSVTYVRILRPIKDVEAQYGFAKKAVEKGWSEAQLKEAVEIWRDRQNNEGEKKGKSAKAPRLSDYDSVSIKALGVKPWRQVLNYVKSQVRDLRAKEADPVKVAHQKGVLEGLEIAAGIKTVPARALVEEADTK